MHATGGSEYQVNVFLVQQRAEFAEALLENHSGSCSTALRIRAAADPLLQFVPPPGGSANIPGRNYHSPPGQKLESVTTRSIRFEHITKPQPRTLHVSLRTESAPPTA